jgi:hypothetical protein
MRLALAFITVLAATAQRACDSGTSSNGGTIVGPREEACRGLACGDSCGYCPPGTDPATCPVPTTAPTACNIRGQCVTAGTFLCKGETCSGRACGVACDGPCPYGVPCLAPVVCDGQGACGPAPKVCGTPPPPTPPCNGKGCGDSCVIDPPCLPAGCLAPSRLGRCDESGQCVPLPEPVACVADPACAGKTCGADCDPCGGLCMHPYTSACDWSGRCVPKGPYLCYDPCAGVACGAGCHLCPPSATDCIESALARACDRNGLCWPAPATCP